MQRSFHVALSFGLLVFLSAHPAEAGQKYAVSHMQSGPRGVTANMSSIHRPHNGQFTRGGERRFASSQRNINRPYYPTTFFGHPPETSVTINAFIQGNRAAPPPLAPLSVSPVDPRTIVSQLPSGRIVMTALHDQRQWRARAGARPSRPYAPPAFHIIGDLPRRHMAKTVQLTHGITPGRRMKTEPQVFFLVQKPGEKRLSVR